MTTNTHNEYDDHDRLLTRIVDGEASGEDWDSFRNLAADNHDVWAELSQTQHTHTVLTDAVRSRASIADTVELPELLADPNHLQHRFDAVSRWGGWAAAAVIMLVWFTGGLPMGGSGPMSASLGPNLSNASSDQAFDQYMQAGQAAGTVISELPDQRVIQAYPMEDGTVQVVIIRQILERRLVTEVLTNTRDETGRLIAVPALLEPIDDDSY